MWSYIISCIALACITFLFVNSEPTIILRDSIYKWFYGCYDYTSTLHWKLINCCLCSGFWIGFIYTGDLKQAAIISILSEYIDKKLNDGKI